MKNTKVLLINCGVSKNNYGDQAINYTLLQILKENFDIVHNENFTEVFNKSKRMFFSYFYNILKMIKIARQDYNYVFIGGGQLILGNRRFPFSLLSWVLLIKIFSRSKVILFGVGVDYKFTFSKKKIINISLLLSDGIYVRDKDSKNNLLSIFKKEAELMPDVVTVLSRFYRPNKIEKKEKSLALFGVTSYSSIKHYSAMNINTIEGYFFEQMLILKDLQSKYDEVKLIYNTDQDYKCSEDFKLYLKEKNKINIEIVDYKDVFSFFDYLANADIIVSSRMHSLIIANSYGVKFVPVIRNKKLETFAKESVKMSNVEDCFLIIQNHINKIKSI